MLSDSCVVSVPEIPCRTSEQFRHGDSSGAAAALPWREGETHGWHGPGINWHIFFVAIMPLHFGTVYKKKSLQERLYTKANHRDSINSEHRQRAMLERYSFQWSRDTFIKNVSLCFPVPTMIDTRSALFIARFSSQIRRMHPQFERNLWRQRWWQERGGMFNVYLFKIYIS